MTDRTDAERVARIEECRAWLRDGPLQPPNQWAERATFLLEEIDSRDATIATLQQERDATTREAETLREEVGRLRRYNADIVRRYGYRLQGSEEAPAQPTTDDLPPSAGAKPQLAGAGNVEQSNGAHEGAKPSADVERAREIIRPWIGPLGLDDTQQSMLRAEIAAALTAARAQERQKQIERVVKLRMRDDDRAPPRNFVEEITAAFPVEDWADILASSLKITEPAAKNAIVRVIASAHAAFTADEVATAHAQGEARLGPTDEEIQTAIKPLWLKTAPSRDAQGIRAALSCDFDDPRFKQWMSDFCPDYVWDLVDIAAQRGIAQGDAKGRAEMRETAANAAYDILKQGQATRARAVRSVIRSLPTPTGQGEDSTNE